MSNLLDRSIADIKNAVLLTSPMGNPENDELLDNLAAYHVQQGIEKAFKYQLEIMGIFYTRTHNLDDLIALLEKNGFSIHEDLNAFAAKISSWEARSRYSDNFVVLRKDITRAINMFEQVKYDILLWTSDRIPKL